MGHGSDVLAGRQPGTSSVGFVRPDNTGVALLTLKGR